MLLINTLQNLPLFKNIQAQTLTTIAQGSKFNYYKKGIVFYDALATEKSEFYYIVKGWVKLFTVSQDGVEIIRDILTDNHHFNEELLYRDSMGFLSAQAISDLQIIMMPIAILKQRLAQDPQLAVNLLTESLQKQCELSHAMEHLAIQNAAQRIGCFLLRLCPTDQSHSISLHFPYSKTLVATKLGMCPETFSRALLKLSKICQLEINGENIHIPRLDFLSKYVCRLCSLSYPCHTILPSLAH